jgi:hypothetical protein
MALTLEQKKKLLKKSSENRAKRHGGGEFFSYLNADLMREHKLSIAQFKKSDDPYYVNMLAYFAGTKDPNLEEGDDTYVLVTKCHNIETANGRRNVICPRAMFPHKNLPCPICEKRIDLMANDPENEKVINSLKVKERELYYIQNDTTTDEKSKGVQIMEIAAYFMGWKIKPLIKKGEGRGKGKPIDISDYENGRTISFSVGEKKTEDGTMPDFTGYSLEKRDPISDDLIDRVLELPPLDELIVVLSYEDLEAMINNESPKESSKETRKDSSEDKEDKSEKKEERKSRLQDRKEKKAKKEFDYNEASAEEMEEFIEENDIEIDEENLGNERKMKIAIKKFFLNKEKDSEDDSKKLFPDKDDISDIEIYFDDLSESDQKAFCKFHKIDTGDDKEDMFSNVERWYY